MLLLWLILTQLLAMLSLVAWGILAGRVVAITDQGVRLSRLVVLWLVWLYPAFPLACAIIAWRAYFAGLERRAWVSTSLPLVLALPLAYFLLRFTPFPARLRKFLRRAEG